MVGELDPDAAAWAPAGVLAVTGIDEFVAAAADEVLVGAAVGLAKEDWAAAHPARSIPAARIRMDVRKIDKRMKIPFNLVCK